MDEIRKIETSKYRDDMQHRLRPARTGRTRADSAEYEPLPDLPRLVIGDRPILRLYFFGVCKRMKQDAIYRLLEPIAAPPDFTITRPKHPPGKINRTWYHNNCKNLITSLRLQHAGLSALLDVGFFSTNKGKYQPCYAQIKPDRCYFQIEPTDKRPNPLISNSLDSHLFIVFTPVLACIYRHLNTDDAYRFTFALFNHPVAVTFLCINYFDPSWPYFNFNDISSYIKSHINEFKPKSIVFKDGDCVLNSGIVKDALSAMRSSGCSRGNASASGVRDVNTIDLRAIKANHRLIDFLADSFKIIICLLGNFTAPIDTHVARINTLRLEISDNFHVTGAFLSEFSAEIVKLSFCWQLSFAALARAVRKNIFVKYLQLHNVMAFDVDA
ncbi:hypothetical protein TKK_0000296 [Trichogramma kaykai]